MPLKASEMSLASPHTGYLTDYIETRASHGEWTKAADRLISELERLQVHNDQVVSIGMHHNGMGDDVIFVAYISKNLPRTGGTKLKYKISEAAYGAKGWADYYKDAIDFSIDVTKIKSITTGT